MVSIPVRFANNILPSWYVFEGLPSPCLVGIRDPIGAEIQRLSKNWDTNNTFIPHVTLVGGIECDLATAKQVTEKLVSAHALRPVDIGFDTVGWGEIFHQTVFIKVEKTDELCQQHQCVLDAFHINGSSDLYMPHMSLIYSHMSCSDRKQLADEEERRVSDLLADVPLPLKGVCNLELWYTPAADTSLKSWKRIESYQLS